MEVVREKDGEGIVITDGSSLPEPGKRTSWKTLKIKKELDNPIDVFLTGNYKTANKDYKGKEIVSWKYWENTRTGDKLEGEYYNDYFRGETVIPSKQIVLLWMGIVYRSMLVMIQLTIRLFLSDGSVISQIV